MFLISRDDIRKIMVNKYLSNPDYNFEKVNRASLACGPLVKWAIAQVCLISIDSPYNQSFNSHDVTSENLELNRAVFTTL